MNGDDLQEEILVTQKGVDDDDCDDADDDDAAGVDDDDVGNDANIMINSPELKY